jgi:hypothetical protein
MLQKLRPTGKDLLGMPIEIRKPGMPMSLSISGQGSG